MTQLKPEEHEKLGERLWKLERKGFFDWLKKQHSIDRPKYPTDIFNTLGFDTVFKLMDRFEAETK